MHFTTVKLIKSALAYAMDYVVGVNVLIFGNYNAS